MKRVLVAFLLLLPFLASSQHRVYKAGNRVMISGQGMNNSAPSENVNVYRVNDRIRVDYGTSGIWLNANTFLDATGKPWGVNIDQAIRNYFEEANSVTVSNLSTDTVNVRLANRQAITTVVGDVNVKNFPSPQSVNVTNWPTSQTVNGTVNANVTFPTTQQVGGVVSIGNWPTSQSVTVTNQPTSLSVSNFPATQPISGTITVSNPTTSVSINGTVTTQNAYQVLPSMYWQDSQASLVALTALQIKAAVAGQRHYVTSIQLSNTAALVSGLVEILDGNTVIARVFVGAAGSANITYPIPLRGSINASLSIRPALAGLVVSASTQGYTSPN